MTKSVVLGFLSLFILSLATTQKAQACSCRDATPLELVTSSDFVLEGTVTRVDSVTPEGVLIVKFTKILRASPSLPAPQLTTLTGLMAVGGFNNAFIGTPIARSSCGIQLTGMVGSEVIFLGNFDEFGNLPPDLVRLNLCRYTLNFVLETSPRYRGYLSVLNP